MSILHKVASKLKKLEIQLPTKYDLDLIIAANSYESLPPVVVATAPLEYLGELILLYHGVTVPCTFKTAEGDYSALALLEVVDDEGDEDPMTVIRVIQVRQDPQDN